MHHPLFCIYKFPISTGSSTRESKPVSTSPWKHTCIQKVTHTNLQSPAIVLGSCRAVSGKDGTQKV